MSDTNARIFRYGLWQYDSRTQARNDLRLARHRIEFSDLACRYRASDVKTIFDQGEEAFAVPCEYKKYDTLGHPESDHVYEIAGASLVVRTRNVLIRVWWAKADYPTSETTKNPHWLRGGKQLAYKQALPQMTQAAKAILTHFPST